MKSKIGPIRPNPYGGFNEKLVNYFRDGEQYFCKIINDLQRIVVMEDWYSHRHVANIDPQDVTGKNRRKIIKEILDEVDWENLDEYPNSTLGVDLDRLAEDKSGEGEFVTYHYKLNGMAMAGLKFEWTGPLDKGVKLKSVEDTKRGLSYPLALVDNDGNTLADFECERFRRYGFVFVDWWITSWRDEEPSVHVVVTHKSNLKNQ